MVCGSGTATMFVIVRKYSQEFRLASKKSFKSIMAAATYRKNALTKHRGELYIVPVSRAPTLGINPNELLCFSAKGTF